MNTFLTLVKREYWENRGGILWAPIVTTIAMTVLLLGLWVLAIAIVGKIQGHVSFGVGINLTQLMQKVPENAIAEFTRGYEIGLLGLSSLIQLVLTIVVFFYCIGALYDDRRDRSILFWKSMPVSDVQTVLSKVATAALLAPAFAFVATVVLHVLFLAVLSLIATVHGNSAMRLVIGPAEPLSLWPRLFVQVFVNALWLLPMYGWLLLASSFARSKAFLWAVFPPIILGFLWSVSELYRYLWLPQSWVWTEVVGRVLPFVMFEDGSQTFSVLGMHIGDQGPTLTWTDIGNMVTSADMWYGVVAGTAMIAGAIWFRRKRELAD